MCINCHEKNYADDRKCRECNKNPHYNLCCMKLHADEGTHCDCDEWEDAKNQCHRGCCP